MTQKVALVTGASRGIGMACARSLAHDGYHVAIHYRSGESEAHSLAGELGEHATCFRADLSVENECTELVNNIKQKFGRIDALINNAGVSIDQVITFAKPGDFDTLIQINLRPVFLLTKLVSRLMIKQKSGTIVNMTSVVGHSGNAGQSMYAATKGAIHSFTKSVALDLAGFGIRANCVAPGFIDTEMTQALPEEVRHSIIERIPLKTLGRPEDIANAVSYLCSERASYITGSTIHVNGGMYTN